jgi:hypothetical protein
VGSFISNRTMAQCLPGSFPRQIGIHQGLPLLSILVLFYNTILVNACNAPTLQASRTGYVDNVNARAFGK